MIKDKKINLTDYYYTKTEIDEYFDSCILLFIRELQPTSDNNN